MSSDRQAARTHGTPPEVAAAPPGWRKRHPVLARALLYGLGLALVGTAAWLLLERRAQDRSDHVRTLWARLDMLPAVILADPSCKEATCVLDDELSDESLPGDLRARAERMRGVAATLRKDRAAMDAAFARARNLDVSQQAVDALVLEWAQCRIDLKDLAGAQQLLKAPPPRNPVLALWRPVIQAHLLEAAGKGEEARINLLTLVDSLPKPLPQVPPTWFMLNDWRFEDVLIEAIRWMAAGLSPGSAQTASLWRRLPEFAPQDVRSLVAAAEGLLSARDVVGARGFWSRAKQLDPVFAAKMGARNAELNRLDAP